MSRFRPDADGSTAIELHGTVRNGDFELDLSLRLAAGQTLAIIGPNGSGKSTLISLLAGHIALEKGELSLNGVVVDRGGADTSWIGPESRPVALVPQDGLLFPHLDVAANIAFGLRHRTSGIDIPARVAAVLAAVELDWAGDRRPDELSGGQAQRIALARALALEEPILILDEPLSRVDVANRRLMRQTIDSHRAPDRAQVIVTHGPEHAREADLVLVLDQGRTLGIAAPDALVADPPSSWVAELFA